MRSTHIYASPLLAPPPASLASERRRCVRSLVLCMRMCSLSMSSPASSDVIRASSRPPLTNALAINKIRERDSINPRRTCLCLLILQHPLAGRWRLNRTAGPATAAMHQCTCPTVSVPACGRAPPRVRAPSTRFANTIAITLTARAYGFSSSYTLSPDVGAAPLCRQ